MDKRKSKIVKMTSIFVVLEAVIIFYISGLSFGVYFFRFFSPITVFEYSPGISLVVKRFFYSYWWIIYNQFKNGVVSDPPFWSNWFTGAEHFLLALWITLIAASAIVAIIYSVRLKGVMK